MLLKETTNKRETNAFETEKGRPALELTILSLAGEFTSSEDGKRRFIIFPLFDSPQFSSVLSVTSRTARTVPRGYTFKLWTRSGIPGRATTKPERLSRGFPLCVEGI